MPLHNNLSNMCKGNKESWNWEFMFGQLTQIKNNISNMKTYMHQLEHRMDVWKFFLYQGHLIFDSAVTTTTRDQTVTASHTIAGQTLWLQSTSLYLQILHFFLPFKWLKFLVSIISTSPVRSYLQVQSFHLQPQRHWKNKQKLPLG